MDNELIFAKVACNLKEVTLGITTKEKRQHNLGFGEEIWLKKKTLLNMHTCDETCLFH